MGRGFGTAVDVVLKKRVSQRPGGSEGGCRENVPTLHRVMCGLSREFHKLLSGEKGAT